MNNKIVIRITYFTDNGKAVFQRLAKDCDGIIFEEKPSEIPLAQWARDSFEQHLPIVFIGATGIAVRAIAAFVDNKLSDSPVIVIDEKGINVIPILSGHFGGANEISESLAKVINANAIITTATDINNAFAIDVFARNNGLRISDSKKIKKVSSSVLAGNVITIKDEVSCKFAGDRPDIIEMTSGEDADVVIGDTPKATLTLIPKRLVIGMGCKKDKSFKELKDFILQSYSEEYLRDNLYAVSTIDVKADEIGLIKLAQYFGAKFITYSAQELSGAAGDFPASDFVKDTVGVSNVCERAAVLAAGLSERDVEKEKVAENGMTLAAAKRTNIKLTW